MTITNQCNGAEGSFYNVQLDYWINSQNVATAKSNITLQLLFYSVDSRYTHWGYDNNSYLKTNYSTVATNSSVPDLRNGNRPVLITWTGDVPHDQNGNLTLPISGGFTDSYWGTPSGEVGTNWSLPSIPRYPSITNLQVVVESYDKISVKWNVSTPVGTITNQQVNFNKTGWITHTSPAIFEDLDEKTEYTVQVRATNSLGNTTTSKEIKVITPESPNNMMIKKNHQFLKGMCFIKNKEWKKGQKVFVKVKGKWESSKI